MCGIAGSYQIDLTKPETGRRIDAAVRCIAHRGPDDEGIARIGRATLGHRRLSIIDTSAAGHQPFTDDDGRYTIVFNGEVFNFKELRKGLEEKGHTFRSRTDTEVVLRLFKMKGPAFLHDLNGFFALAIHDREKDELFLARDRFGVKPLWWCEHEGRLLFSSELRALMELGAPRVLDRVSLRQYLRFHYIAAPHSILRGVNKLLPGHGITASAIGMKIERWYSIEEAAAARPQASDPSERLRELMDDSVRLRLISDVPIGTFLSGGLDSSVVSALAIRHKPDLRTFSIGYADDPYFDESAHAEAVAQHIGSQHTTFKLTRDDLASHYTQLLDAIDEPFADSSALPSFILCKHTRQHVTVVLSGDGADEIFGGYRKHQAELRMRSPGMMEALVKLGAPLWKSLPRSRNNAFGDRVRQLHRFVQAARRSEADRYLSMAAFEEEDRVDALTGGPARSMEEERRMQAITAPLQAATGLNGVLLADLHTVLPNDMLHKVDLTSMAHALEVRTPFLDRRVVELAFRLKPELKFRRGGGKQLVREAFAGLLPTSTLTRRKQGFEVPLLELFRGPLAGELNDLIQPGAVEAAGLDRPAVNATLTALASRDPGNAQATAHALAVYLSWWKRWGITLPATT